MKYQEDKLTCNYEGRGLVWLDIAVSQKLNISLWEQIGRFQRIYSIITMNSKSTNYLKNRKIFSWAFSKNCCDRTWHDWLPFEQTAWANEKRRLQCGVLDKWGNLGNEKCNEKKWSFLSFWTLLWEQRKEMCWVAGSIFIEEWCTFVIMGSKCVSNEC